MNHLSSNTLDLYLDDRLDPPARAAAHAHLAGCERCRAELDALREVFLALETLEPEPIPVDLSARVLERIAPVAARPARRPYVAALLVVQVALTLLLALWLGPPPIDWAGLDRLVVPGQAVLSPVWLAAYAPDFQAVIDLVGRLRVLPNPLAAIAPEQWLYLIVAAGIIWLAGNRLLLAGLNRSHDMHQEARP